MIEFKSLIGRKVLIDLRGSQAFVVESPAQKISRHAQRSMDNLVIQAFERMTGETFTKQKMEWMTVQKCGGDGRTYMFQGLPLVTIWPVQAKPITMQGVALMAEYNYQYKDYTV